MWQNLNGKHALVTGGGTGIGLAIAQALAAHGALVTITGRRADVLETAAGKTPGLFPAVMDVTSEASVAEVTATAVAQRGPVTVCVANAGIAVGKAFHKTTLEDWRETMTTNLDGAFLTIRESLVSMRGLEWGRVIGVSSIAGLKGLKGAPAYTASKHGLTGLIRGLSADYVETGLTFNSICPGYVETAIIDQNVKNIAARTGMDHEAARAIMVNTNPHKRLITPEEVADAALWLCSDNSGSVNGTAIEIAGGEL